MKHSRNFLITLLALASATPALFGQGVSPQLTYVLKQMDTASKSFRQAAAEFQWDYYERVVHDTTTQKGSIYFERSGNAIDMGAVIVNPDEKAKPKYLKVIQYHAGIVQMFDPGVDQITVLHEGANQADIEGYLTLGFGGSGADLAKAWNITDLGPETITDNGKPIKVEKLDLVGKSAETQKNFTHITIWVDPTRAISLKQIFYTPSGDRRTATYFKVNGNVHKDQFAIKKDKNTTVVNH